MVVIKYFATSKNTFPSAFLRSQFTQSHYTRRGHESNSRFTRGGSQADIK